MLLGPLPPTLAPPPPLSRDAVAGKGPPRQPQRRLDRRLEEVAKAIGGGYCRLQMPLKLALAVRETVAGHRLGALEGGGGVVMEHVCRRVLLVNKDFDGLIS